MQKHDIYGSELIMRTDAAGIWAHYGTTVNHFCSYE